jgi:Amt family ammonium transporter
MRFGTKCLVGMVLTATLILSVGTALAQTTSEGITPPSEPDLHVRIEEVSQQAAEAALAGHNAWMLVSCALVLFMTAPGLAMFYSGLVRKKNVLGVMMQCIFLMV